MVVFKIKSYNTYCFKMAVRPIDSRNKPDKYIQIPRLKHLT